MMKKLLCVLLALCFMLCALSACTKFWPLTKDGSADNTPENDTDKDVTETEKADEVEPTDEIDYRKYFDDEGHFIGVTASEIVTLPEYKGVAIPADVLTANEDDVQAQLDSIKEYFTEYEHITDRAVEDGDTVNIDYVGSIDGVEFDGGSTGGRGTDVTIGVTSYIDDFLEQLIGHKPGETINVEVTFPESYPQNKDLENKDALFVTTINYIQEPIETELTDEMVSEYTGGEITTVDAMREDCREYFVSEQKSAWYQELVSSAQCDSIPEIVTEFLKESALENYRQAGRMYGMELDDILASIGYDSADDFFEDSKEDMESAIRGYLAAQAIAEAEGLKVTDEDLENEGFTSDMIDTYGRGYLCFAVLQDETVPEFIYENSVVG